MNKISCEICLDLIPLVKDNIASEDSKVAVNEHIKNCNSCKSLYEETNIKNIENIKMDDSRVLNKIKNRLYLSAVVIMTLGTIFGLGLTMVGMGLFYNILIMPTIGAIGYFALSKKAYYVPIIIFIFTYIWTLISFVSQAILSDFSFVSILTIPMYGAGQFSMLSGIGIFIGFLLKVAFGKENEDGNE